MKQGLTQKIQKKQATIGLLGLGYVGLSLMEAFGKAKFSVVGYDLSQAKIKSLHRGEIDFVGVHLPTLQNLLLSGRCRVSSSQSILKEADVFIIAVSTPLDVHRQPDLSHIRKASRLVLKYLRKDSLVVLQSTSYPGTVEDEILPILQESKLKEGVDFHLAFVPEISDFGNMAFDFANIPKVIGGLTTACAKVTKDLYRYITKNLTLVPSLRVAEAAKILQNTYRLINISFINEMKVMFDRMGLDVWEVIEAAAKKPFGFVPFYPGPGVGGDCIPVNAYYLIWKAKETQGPTSLLELASEINTHIPDYVTGKVVDVLSQEGIASTRAKVLLLGVAFKKDVSDIRESASLRVAKELQKKGIGVFYHDPYVKTLTSSFKSIRWDVEALAGYDCIVILTDHTFYPWKLVAKEARHIVDTRNVMASFPQFKHKVVKA